MANVTGLTAERMMEMEAQTVIDGNVVGDDLILLTRDGTPINAGSVRGPQGVPGPAVRHVIQDEGVTQSDQPTLDFVGQGVTVTEDVPNNKLLVAIPTAGHVIYDEGNPRTQRSGLKFSGLRISVADDAANNVSNVVLSDGLLYYHGGWSASVFNNRDVVGRWGGYWVWPSATPSTPAQEPGVGTNSWALLSGIPVMTTAQIAAWTAVGNGNQVWNYETNQLFVYENGWVAVSQFPMVDSRYGLGAGPDLTSSSPVNWGIDITYTIPNGANALDISFVMALHAIGTVDGQYAMNVLIDTVNQQNLSAINIPFTGTGTQAYTLTRTGLSAGQNVRFTTQARRLSANGAIRATISPYWIQAIYYIA